MRRAWFGHQDMRKGVCPACTRPSGRCCCTRALRLIRSELSRPAYGSAFALAESLCRVSIVSDIAASEGGKKEQKANAI